MSCQLRWLSLFAMLPATVIQAGQPLQVGAASAKITPPIGFPMWGYAVRHDAPSIGVLDPLIARAIVLQAGESRLAIISLDLGRPPTRASTQSIRDRLRADGISEIMLVASHTHHGPLLELETWPDPKSPYTKSLEDKLVELVRAAKHGAKPAKWGVASRDESFNRNRQSKRPDAPVDRQLTVVRFSDLDGKPIVHLVHLAAHPTILPSSLHQFSADYPGALCRLLEKETGAPCLFLQGAAGDLSPSPPAGVSGHIAFGETVGRAALNLLKSVKCDAGAESQIQVHTESFTFRARLDVSSALVRAALSRVFFPELVAFYEREYREGVRPETTVALLDGKLALVGMSGEMFCGHSLSLRRRARLETVLLCGYCNDYQQYFPTIEAASEGGFGTVPPVGMAEIGAGEKMVDRALITLFRMRGLLPDELATDKHR